MEESFGVFLECYNQVASIRAHSALAVASRDRQLANRRTITISSQRSLHHIHTCSVNGLGDIMK